MIYKNLRLRHEYKYYIPYAEYLAMRGRVSAFLTPDNNMPSPEGYHVRSLYFDDPVYSARFEKVSGYKNRSKTRIRIYNKDLETIRLEKKIKIFGYIGKRTAIISKKELDAIINRKTAILLASPNKVVQRFYADLKTKLLRPVVLVDYMREAYYYRMGNVRITFDHNLQAVYGGFDSSLSDKGLIFKNVYPPGLLVMEVKFDDFLPTAVKRLIRPYTARRMAISKYVMALNAAGIGEKYGIEGFFFANGGANNNTDDSALVSNTHTGNISRDANIGHMFQSRAGYGRRFRRDRHHNH